MLSAEPVGEILRLQNVVCKPSIQVLYGKTDNADSQLSYSTDISLFQHVFMYVRKNGLILFIFDVAW